MRKNKKFPYKEGFIKDNMEEILLQATSSIYKEAKEWYPKAHECAEEFAEEFGKPLEVTSALISVLSPQKEWHHNLELTRDFLKRMKCRHVGTQVSKAQAIYDYTMNYPEEERAAFIERMLNGPKTVNFFWNIYSPASMRHATIDRHMIWALTGDYSLTDITTKQYDFLKKCLIEYADAIKMIPSELQSVIWLTTKSIKAEMKAVEKLPEEFVVEGEDF